MAKPCRGWLENTAAAQARGQINAEHIAVIRGFLAHLPDSIDAQSHQDAEAKLARIACEQDPKGLRKAADLLLALLHPDGDYTDAERNRRRGLTMGNQQVDGMSRLSRWMTPELRATLEPIFAKWGAPGMCNPNDQLPTIDGEPTDAAIDGDDRTQYQRNHDAILAMGRSLLCSGQLGQHNGLPTTIIVTTTTLQQLESGIGHAITAGGTRLPMADVIAQACQPDNNLIEQSQWSTRKRKDGRTELIPPPHLDTGQARVNDLHHPERMLRPTDNGESDQDDEGP